MKAVQTLTFISLLLVLGLGACKNPAPAPTDSPLVSPLTLNLDSPAAAPSGSSQITGPSFVLDPPVPPGATEVTGQGPIGLSIVIVDMTTLGTPLGYGTIDQDGAFSVALDQPAIENHVIGIQVIQDREFSPEDIEQLAQRKGPGFKTYPRVGNVLDSVVVRNP